MFYVILCDQHGRQLTRLPGVAVLGAGATSPGTVEGSQAMLVGQWAFSGAVSGGLAMRSPAVNESVQQCLGDLEIWRGICFTIR